MKTTTKVALGVGVVCGYVLGRLKMGRLAFAAATYLAGQRFGLDPRQLATEGLRKLGEMPQVAELGEEVKGELWEAGKQALATAANRGLVDVPDSLRERTSNLGKPQDRDEQDDELGDEDEDREPDDEQDEEPVHEGAASSPPLPTSGNRTAQRGPRAGAQPSPEHKPPRKTAAPAGEASAQTVPPAKRSTSRLAPARAPAKKTPAAKASTPAKKTAARKTAAPVGDAAAQAASPAKRSMSRPAPAKAPAKKTQASSSARRG